jgi:hypothetical protein
MHEIQFLSDALRGMATARLKRNETIHFSVEFAFFSFL